MKYVQLVVACLQWFPMFCCIVKLNHANNKPYLLAMVCLKCSIFIDHHSTMYQSSSWLHVWHLCYCFCCLRWIRYVQLCGWIVASSCTTRRLCTHTNPHAHFVCYLKCGYWELYFSIVLKKTCCHCIILIVWNLHCYPKSSPV